MGDGAIITIVIFVTLGLTAIGVPLAKALARRIESGTSNRLSAGATPEVSARLARMEQALDTIAVEVERISETQRFTTKLLADRAGTASERSS